VGRARRAYIGSMSQMTLSDDAAWAAFEARDRAFEGRFIVAVTTTGIYCKPTCPARRPLRGPAGPHRRAGTAAPRYDPSL